jgi:uncharacterized protein
MSAPGAARMSASGAAGMTTLVVLAKEPVAGRVKTRLNPPFSYDQAALLARAALTDTLAAVARTPARERILVLDGNLPPQPGFRTVSQVDGGLDARIAAALAQASGPVLLVGMDTPQLTPDLLTVRWDADAYLGPAADGGYWAIGLRDPALARQVLPGVPMSTADTGRVQLERLRAAGLSVAPLPRLRDVDTVADAYAVAALAPDTVFAATLRELAAVPA